MDQHPAPLGCVAQHFPQARAARMASGGAACAWAPTCDEHIRHVVSANFKHAALDVLVRDALDVPIPDLHTNVDYA